MTQECQNCKMCHKRGLPVLPTRYALAAEESGAPELSAPFDIHAGIGAILPAPGKGLDWVVEKWATGLPSGRSAVELPKSTGNKFSKGNRYTQRLLRAGYLYVLEERVSGVDWRAFTVTEEGYLMEFDFPRSKENWNAACPPLNENAKVPCNPEKNDMLARCITIDDPENVNVVWFAFSDVAWTYSVYRKHDANTDNYRARNMRKFDVVKWLGRKEHEHVCKVEEAEKHIAEFATINDQYVSGKGGAFGFCKNHAPFCQPKVAEDWPAMGLQCEPPIKTAHPDYATLEEKEEIKKHYRKPASGTGKIVPMQSPMKRLSLQCARATEGGSKKVQGMAAVLAIHDPAGITMDLATMIDWRLAWFNEDQYRRMKRKIVISGIIENLRTSIMNNAESDLQNRLEQVEEQQKKLGDVRNPVNYDQTVAFHLGLKSEKADIQEKLKDPEKTRKKAWEKYEDRYDPKRPPADYADSQKELKDFNTQTINPLALAHSAWMRSEDLRNYFDCNFDTASLESGYVYTTVFTLCIGNMQQCAVFQDMLYRWFGDELFDKNNLLLRSMYFNNQKWIEIFKMAKAAVGDGSKYVGTGQNPYFEPLKFWEDFFGKSAGIMDKAVDDPGNPTNGLLANLVSRTSSAFALHVRNHYSNAGVTSTKQLPIALVNLAGATRTPLVPVRVNSTTGYDLRKLTGIVFKHARENKVPVTRAMVRNVLSTYSGPQQALSATTTRMEVVVLDTDAFRSKAKELAKVQGASTQAKLVASLDAAIKSGSVEDVDKFRREYSQKVSGTGGAKAVGSVFSVISSVIQFINYVDTYKSFTNNKEVKPFLRDEKLHKFIGATINMATAASDLA